MIWLVYRGQSHAPRSHLSFICHSGVVVRQMRSVGCLTSRSFCRLVTAERVRKGPVSTVSAVVGDACESRGLRVLITHLSILSTGCEGIWGPVLSTAKLHPKWRPTYIVHYSGQEKCTVLGNGVPFGTKPSACSREWTTQVDNHDLTYMSDQHPPM